MTARALCLQRAFAICIGLSALNAYADLTSAIGECRTIAATAEESDTTVVMTAACPGLTATIEASSWADVLRPGWQEDLTYREMVQLGHLASHYNQQAASGVEMSLSPLDQIVAGLTKAPTAEKVSLWARFMDWLRDLLTDETGNSPGWWPEWLSNFEISQTVAEIIFWVLTAVIIVAAIVVVVAEIRAVRRPAPAPADRPETTGGTDGLVFDDRPLTLKDLESASLTDRPSILLRLLMQRLEKLGIAKHRPACTHRELRQFASRLGSDDVEVFSLVSKSAEQIRFGGRPIAPPQVSQVVSTGVALLRRLEPGSV